MKIDKVDQKILQALVKDSSQSIKEIATKVNLSVSPVHDRIRKMMSSGIIEGYSARINPEMMGFGLLVYIQVRFVRHQEQLFEEFVREISRLHEVQEAVFTAGEYDALLKVYLKDMEDYQHFVLQRLSKMEFISNVKSSFAMRTIASPGVILNAERLGVL
ncbi:Lrp/AsnC family transcriptional regulator [Bergeyella sp. RCAD1439]|uniref:Lrp/AsnC family transcriptional regulator n=1 Tax=Bergeyella anatis TaxID=3113737 RepID=UPI002E193BCA|nr:Lrp/AsnC family transcriptional regulator [Bergeyella sp. RCAD1439]